MSDITTPVEIAPFRPEAFGFFLRRDWNINDIQFFEKEHSSIDKSVQGDWLRINLFLSRSGDFICIWYGVIDPAMADFAYEERHGFTWSEGNMDESLFRGYIKNKEEAEIILRAIRIEVYGPQYLGK